MESKEREAEKKKMLSFTDFMKVFSAYEQYVQTQPTVPTPALQPQPMPTVPTPALQPQPMPTVPMPTVPTPALQPQSISMDEYVRRLDEFEQRLSAQERRPPMPTISTPKPTTVDDIILGIVGNAGKENSNGEQ